MIRCILAEKPSVARDIARIVGARNKEEGYLEGNGYLITWAMGHLITLAMPEAYGCKEYQAEALPITPNPFQLIVRQIRKGKDFVAEPSAVKQVKIIRQCFEQADDIVVATDAGREGELIFRYIYDYLNCHKPFRRLWISSLTDKAIQEGLNNLEDGSKYDKLYQSAKARSEADWQVGINASRALSIAKRGSYSLGRVQTPTLAMICKRYLEHKHFKTVPYWKLNATLLHNGLELKAVCGEQFLEQAQANRELQMLNTCHTLSVLSSEQKESKIEPPLLYDLTSLQKEANKQYGFTADKTLSLAQSLYEKKVTTYPRTGSRYISTDVFEEVPALLKSIGVDLSSLNPHSVNNNKLTDHHAIIITGETPNNLSSDEQVLYQMIKTRFVEAFSPYSEEEHLHIVFSDNRNEFHWKAKRSICLGWKAVRQEAKTDEDLELNEFPIISEGDCLPLVNSSISEHSTKAKPIYTEASLLSAMENAGREVEDDEKRKAMSDCGIGTPATRANIIETLILRQYILRNKKQLLPTEKGLAVYEIIKDKQIANAEMTGSWEEALGLIEQGQKDVLVFRDEIIAYSKQICNELLSLQSETPDYPVFTCPKCQRTSVGIYRKVATCREEDCDFHIFRERCGSYLSEENVQDLINTGKTAMLRGLRAKSGKKFNARLVLDEDFKTKFEFEPKTSSKKTK